MTVRKKLITYKNMPSVLAVYVKRHQVFLKTVLAPQQAQQSFFLGYKRFQAVDFFIQAASPGRLTPMQLESVHRGLIRQFARLFRFWQLIRFTEMVTAKPNEIRMGKGKGAFSFWSRSVPVGFPILEVGFVTWCPRDYFYHIFRRLRSKLPIHIVVRTRHMVGSHRGGLF